MTPFLHWLTSPAWAQVVTTLLHSLWQGAILALALALLLRRLGNPVARYRSALGALCLLLIANLLTWAILNQPQLSTAVETPATALAIPATTMPVLELNSPAKTIVIAPLTASPERTNWTAWIALAWIFGALTMLLRGSIKVAGAEKLRRSCRPCTDDHITQLVTAAGRAIGLARKIRVAVTDQFTSPAVIGVLVPTLILPLSLFTTLTPTQIQFVLLHELAHIRRGDYLANILQLLAESLWFFNPAVWWISHQIRREREACCDALATELSDSPADYARTLVHVAETILQPAPSAAAAFGEAGREQSSLTDRVHRLLIPGYRPALRLTWRAMLTAMLVGVTLLFLGAVGTRNVVGAISPSSNASPAKSTGGDSERPEAQPFALRHQGKADHISKPTPANLLDQTNFFSIGNWEPPANTQLYYQSFFYRTSGAMTDERPFSEKPPHQPLPIEITGGSIAAKANSEEIVASNGVHVMFEDKELTADAVHVNRKTGTVTGRGNARLDTPEGDYTAEEIQISGRKLKFAPTETALRDSLPEAVPQETSPPSSPLTTRTFQVVPSVINEAIEASLPRFKPVTATNVTAGLHALLESSGADLAPPKSIFYNDRAGGLFVRATSEDLDAIEGLLQVIGRQPPQVNIKAVFVELPLGRPLPTELARILDPITNVNSTNFTGIISASQFRILLRGIENSASIKILATPQVTTLSGRLAQLQVTDQKTIVNGLTITGVVTNNATNLVYQTQTMSFGTTLDVIPLVSSDGYAVQMTLTPTITEFLGYEDPKKLKLSAPADGATFPLPIIRKRQITTAASIRDGQTIVLGNLSDQMLEKPTVLKNTQGPKNQQSKQLLVFVTPTIIDPSGSPANKDLGLPSTLIR